MNNLKKNYRLFLYFSLIDNKLILGSGVTVNSVHPGLVDTEITRHMSFFNSKISAIILKPFIWMFIRSPRQGAQTILYAALDPNLENVTGTYLRLVFFFFKV